MPTSNNVVRQCCMPKDSPTSCDHCNSHFYWLFIFILKIVENDPFRYRTSVESVRTRQIIESAFQSHGYRCLFKITVALCKAVYSKHNRRYRRECTSSSPYIDPWAVCFASLWSARGYSSPAPKVPGTSLIDMLLRIGQYCLNVHVELSRYQMPAHAWRSLHQACAGVGNWRGRGRRFQISQVSTRCVDGGCVCSWMQSARNQISGLTLFTKIHRRGRTWILSLKSRVFNRSQLCAKPRYLSARYRAKPRWCHR